MISSEILEEIRILKERMDVNCGCNTPFSKIVFAITRRLTRGKLFDMTDSEMVKHIQKMQILESNEQF